MRDDRTGTVMSKSVLPRYGLNSTACQGLGLLNNIYTLKKRGSPERFRVQPPRYYQNFVGFLAPQKQASARLSFFRPSVAKAASRGLPTEIRSVANNRGIKLPQTRMRATHLPRGR